MREVLKGKKCLWKYMGGGDPSLSSEGTYAHSTRNRHISLHMSQMFMGGGEVRLFRCFMTEAGHLMMVSTWLKRQFRSGKVQGEDIEWRFIVISKCLDFSMRGNINWILSPPTPVQKLKSLGWTSQTAYCHTNYLMEELKLISMTYLVACAELCDTMRY